MDSDKCLESGGHVYQQTVGFHMGTNCVPLVADLFFEFILN